MLRREDNIRRHEQRGRGLQGGRGERRGVQMGFKWNQSPPDDHVINHGLSLREAGQRFHPNMN